MSIKRIVGLGLCVLDRFYRVDDFSLVAPRIRYREHVATPGGMVSTALCQAAALGCKAQLLSMVGNDSEGRWLARELRARGVETRRLLRSDRFATSECIVLVDRRSAERRFIVADRRQLEAHAPAFDLEPIRRDSLLLVDGHFPDQALAAVKRARGQGAVVIGDFSQPSPAVRRLLPYVDHPVVSSEFVEGFRAGDPHQTLRALGERYGGTPVITQGHRGALVLERGRIRRIPSRRVRARDTTGAGDVFHGALAAGLVHGQDLLSALDLATRAAALSCTALGGTGRLLRRSEM